MGGIIPGAAAGPGISHTSGQAAPTGRLHHTEIWVSDIAMARSTLGWLFEELGYAPGESWKHGTNYVGAHDYLVLEAGPDVLERPHRRRAPGINHLAFRAGDRRRVDELTQEALQRGFILLFAEAHPHAGGPGHYAAYLEDPAGMEIELVADDRAEPTTEVDDAGPSPAA